MNSRLLLRRLAALPLLLAPLGCGSDDDDRADGGEAGPTYVFMTQVYTADDRTVFLKFTDSLDVEEDTLSIDDAYEFPSIANFEAIDGKLHVSSGESKTITDYEVTPSHDLVEGVTLDFSDYPLDDNANFHYQYVVGEEKVVLPYSVTSRLVWDPKEMRITDTLEDTAIPYEENGLTVGSDGNRSATRFDEGPMMQPFYTYDANDLYGPVSYIATYDDDIEETDAFSVDCPGLERVTRAEDGTTYFGTQWNLPFRHLYGEAAEPCAVRTLPDGSLDQDWTTNFTDLTDGRYVVNFRYLRGGKAIGNVIDHEAIAEAVGVDYESDEFDPAVEDEIWKGGYTTAWLFDVEENTAKEIEGIDAPLTPVLQSEVVDDRIFILVPNTDYDRTKIYEISDDAVATLKYELTGDGYKIERLR